jgi:GTPase
MQDSNSADAPKFVCGFVSILGRPNSGKSTLMNALLGTKLSIVADKPQTTRNVIQGVVTLPQAQIVFLDTPGIHRSGGSLLNRRMMDGVHAALEERDLLLYLVDATRPFKREDDEALQLVERASTPIILVFNKVDIVRSKGSLLPLIEQYRQKGDFADFIPVSALTGEGLEILREAIVSRLPEGPPVFPPDHLTEQPERFLAAEIIREKITLETRQEVPHSVAVYVDEWKDEKKITRISATIYVERDGQKAILIGAKGSMLKQIGSAARTDIEALIGRQVFLELFVKVRSEWRENPAFLDELDRSTRSSLE